jgi:hypothetical protein
MLKDGAFDLFQLLVAADTDLAFPLVGRRPQLLDLHIKFFSNTTEVELGA